MLGRLQRSGADAVVENATRAVISNDHGLQQGPDRLCQARAKCCVGETERNRYLHGPRTLRLAVGLGACDH